MDFLPFEGNAQYTFENFPSAYDSGAVDTFIDTALFAFGAVALGVVTGGALAWLVERFPDGVNAPGALAKAD